MRCPITAGLMLKSKRLEQQSSDMRRATSQSQRRQHSVFQLMRERQAEQSGLNLGGWQWRAHRLYVPRECYWMIRLELAPQPQHLGIVFYRVGLFQRGLQLLSGRVVRAGVASIPYAAENKVPVLPMGDRHMRQHPVVQVLGQQQHRDGSGDGVKERRQYRGGRQVQGAGLPNEQPDGAAAVLQGRDRSGATAQATNRVLQMSRTYRSLIPDFSRRTLSACSYPWQGHGIRTPAYLSGSCQTPNTTGCQRRCAMCHT